MALDCFEPGLMARFPPAWTTNFEFFTDELQDLTILPEMLRPRLKTSGCARTSRLQSTWLSSTASLTRQAGVSPPSADNFISDFRTASRTRFLVQGSLRTSSYSDPSASPLM